MAGFQTLEMPRPRFSNGVPQPSFVDIRLVRPVKAPLEINARTGLARVTPSLIAEIRSLRSKGLSHKAIALACKTSMKTAGRYSKGVPEPKQGWPAGYKAASFNVAKAQRMSRAGFSRAEIAEEMGVHLNTVTKVLRRAAGLPDWPVRIKKSSVTRAMISVYEVTGLKREDIFAEAGADRAPSTPDAAKARYLVFWLLNRRLGMTLIDVGQYLGGFDPSSVSHGIHRVELAASSLRVNLDGSKMGAFRRLWVGSWPARKAA